MNAPPSHGVISSQRISWKIYTAQNVERNARYFSIGDNGNFRQSSISLDNEAAKALDQKQFWIKQSLLKSIVQILLLFISTKIRTLSGNL